MPNTRNSSPAPVLTTAVVLRVRDGSCDVVGPVGSVTARFAPQIPTPHTERVRPGNLVATAAADDGQPVVLWRWFDAVVVDAAEDGRIVLWEPAHGEVIATARPGVAPAEPGSRVYASAGLPGADWWAAAAVPTVPGRSTVPVELDAVLELYHAYGLWSAALAPPP